MTSTNHAASADGIGALNDIELQSVDHSINTNDNNQHNHNNTSSDDFQGVAASELPEVEVSDAIALRRLLDAQYSRAFSSSGWTVGFLAVGFLCCVLAAVIPPGMNTCEDRSKSDCDGEFAAPILHSVWWFGFLLILHALPRAVELPVLFCVRGGQYQLSERLGSSVELSFDCSRIDSERWEDFIAFERRLWNRSCVRLTLLLVLGFFIVLELLGVAFAIARGQFVPALNFAMICVFLCVQVVRHDVVGIFHSAMQQRPHEWRVFLGQNAELYFGWLFTWKHGVREESASRLPRVLRHYLLCEADTYEHISLDRRSDGWVAQFYDGTEWPSPQEMYLGRFVLRVPVPDRMLLDMRNFVQERGLTVPSDEEIERYLRERNLNHGDLRANHGDDNRGSGSSADVEHGAAGGDDDTHDEDERKE